MIIPIRCFTCGKVLADKYDYYIAEVNKLEKDMKKTGTGAAVPPVAVASSSKAKPKAAAAPPVPATGAPVAAAHDKQVAPKHFDTVQTGEILNSLGLTRYCCRRHLISTVDMMDTI